ncbi:3D domain-containing protein [Desulforamulus ruminis]|uniref:3D domain-containing protein n=1 Tax=Desulforamulus ruminis TaxID=1564 RepID=UPI0006747078|nr:3D domain-containing protein [Desulforamulus ruminis]
MRKLVIFVALAAVLYSPAEKTFTEDGPPFPIQQVSRGKDKTILLMEATAYCYTGRRTASGTWPSEERTIAADPAILPLGTKVYIDGFGCRIVEDTGKDIKGNRIDVYIKSHAAAVKFGRQNLNVTVLE